MSNLTIPSIIRKDIPGYEGLYYATSDGKIFSYAKEWVTGEYHIKFKRPESELKQSINRGYYRLGLTKDGRQKYFKVHRLIALAFIPNEENKPFINHKNGIKTDNRAENLEWCTAKENVQHAFNAGLFNSRKGEKNSNAILNESQVIEIRASGLKCTELGKIYNVRPEMISHIRNRRNWKNV